MLQKDFMSYQIEIKEEKDNKNLTKFHNKNFTNYSSLPCFLMEWCCLSPPLRGLRPLSMRDDTVAEQIKETKRGGTDRDDGLSKTRD